MSKTVNTAVMVNQNQPGNPAKIVTKPLGQVGQAYHHILDVDQPRPAGDFLDTGINFRKIGANVAKNLREMKEMIYEDEGADLAERINIQGPTVIGGGLAG